MEDRNTNLIARDDTMLGICHGLGEDFGFSPNWIRLALSVGLFFNPVGAIGTYLALGVLVLFSRLVFPNPKVAPAAAAPVEAPAAPAPAPVEVDLISRQLLPLAA